MLKVWNVSLVIVTFFLTIFGTFMTRSGVVQSVHAFGEDRELAWMFTVFMVVDARRELRPRDLPAAAAARAQRARLLGVARSGVPRQQLGAAVRRVLRAVRDDVPDAERSHQGRAAHRRRAVLQQVDDAGRARAAVPDRRRAAARVAQVDARQPPRPVPVADARRRRDGAASTRAFGIPFWASGLCFALCAFVTVTIMQEFVRGARVRREATGTDLFTALVGLFARSRRRYGGYVVHLGIVLIFLGFAGNGFKRGARDQPEAGPAGRRRRRTLVRYQRLTVTDDGQKQMVTAELNVTRDGKPAAGHVSGALVLPQSRTEPTTEVALRRRLRGRPVPRARRLRRRHAGRARSRVIVNPLVNWIWFGVGVMLIGTIIALLPERAFAFATAQVPERRRDDVAARCWRSSPAARPPLRAQHVEAAQTGRRRRRSRRSRRSCRARSSACAATCGRKRIGECTCAGRGGDARRDRDARQRRARLATRSSSTSSRSTAARKCSPRRSTRLQSPGVAVPVRRGPRRHRRRRRHRAALVAAGPSAAKRRRRCSRRPRPRSQERLDDELRDLD